MSQALVDHTIAFIGGGNMASAIISGLLHKGHPANQMLVAEPNEERANWLKETYSVRIAGSTSDAIQEGQVIVLAVKPQIIKSVCDDVPSHLSFEGKVFVSIAAGTSIANLADSLGEATAIVRLMPNMPALVGAGMSGLYANLATSEEQKSAAMAIAKACGDCIEVKKEEDINAVTALSGSGPAYFLLMMDAMMKAGEGLGLNHQEVYRLVTQTALGAAKLAIASDASAEQLCQQIASKGGTTEAALNTLNASGVPLATEQAVTAAFHRANELSKAV